MPSGIKIKMPSPKEIEKLRETAAVQTQAKEEKAKAITQSHALEREKSRIPLETIAKMPTPEVKGPVVDPAFRDAQIKLMQNYQDRIDGKTPSLAEMQFKQASNTALQKSLGAVRGGIGSNSALAARTAALSTGAMLGNQANESAMLRLKEQQAAQEGLAGLTAQGRSGDATIRGQDIGVLQGNAQTEMQQRGLGASIYNNILQGDIRRQEGYFDRGANVQMSKNKGGGGSDSALNSLIPIVAGGIATAVGGPAAGAVAAGATGAAMPTNSAGQAGPFRDETPVAKPNFDVTGASLTGMPGTKSKINTRLNSPLLPKSKGKRNTMM